MKAFLHDFDQPSGGQQITLPEAGRLSVGERIPATESKPEHPGKLDYFRVYGADMAVEAAFINRYGEKPKELEVTFLSNNPMEVCRTQYQLRCGSVKYAFGDGQTFRHWEVSDWKQPDRKGKMVETVVHSEGERDKLLARLRMEAIKVGEFKRLTRKSIAAIEWKQRCTLQLYLPGIGVAGTWIFGTSGKATSVKKIAGVFQTVLLSARRVQFLPFKLRVSIVKGDTMERKSYPMVELIPPSAATIDAVNKYGPMLFADLYGKAIGGLTEQELLDASKRLELEPASGVQYNAAPPVEAVPPPAPLMENMAATYFEEADEQQSQEGPTEPATANPHEPGTFAWFLQEVRRAATWSLLAARFAEAKAHQSKAALRQAYAIRAAQLAPDADTLNKLVRTYTELHQVEGFINAVTKRRTDKGWKKPTK